MEQSKKSLKELHAAATEIIQKVFGDIPNSKVNNVSAICLLNSNSEDLYITCGYFVTIEGKNYHEQVNAAGYEEVLQKLELQVNHDKNNFSITKLSLGRKPEDIKL